METAHTQSSGQAATVEGSGSLRRQLFGTIGTMLLLLVAASLAGIVFLVGRTEQQGWQGRQREATQRVAQTVGNFIARQQNLLQVLDAFGRDELEELSGELSKLLARQPSLLELVYVDAKGQIVANAPEANGVLANLFTIAQSQWFNAAIKGQHYIGDVQLSARDEPSLTFSIPSIGGGVFASRLRMTLLNEVIADLHFGEAGIAYLVNQDGRVVAHSDSRLVLNQTRLDNQPELLGLIRNTRDQWSGEYIDFQGHPVVGTMIPVPGTPWVAVTELPRNEAFAASRQAHVAGLGVRSGLWCIAGSAHLPPAQPAAP